MESPSQSSATAEAHIQQKEMESELRQRTLKAKENGNVCKQEQLKCVTFSGHQVLCSAAYPIP